MRDRAIKTIKGKVTNLKHITFVHPSEILKNLSTIYLYLFIFICKSVYYNVSNTVLISLFIIDLLSDFFSHYAILAVLLTKSENKYS